MRKEKHLHRKIFSLGVIQINRLKRMATVTGMSESEIVRQAIDLFMDQREASLGLTPIAVDAKVESKNGDS